MKKLLIYFPSNKRTIAMESMILGLKNSNIDVYFFSTCKKGELQEELTRNGIECTLYTPTYNKLFNYVLHVITLARFCRKNHIDVVHSHLQDSNVVAVISQFLCNSKFYIFRHHFNYQTIGKEKSKRNRNEILGERLVNLFSKVLIVPSKGVYNAILANERVNKHKLKIVPYIYDFSKYKKPELDEVQRIKSAFPAKLRLIMVSRFIKPKRHLLIFKIIKELVVDGYNDLVLFAMDDGPEKKILLNYIKENNLEDFIITPGYKENIIDYMAACDLLLHPSVYDASNSVVKEMGLLEKPVAVVEGIGDFNEYIVNGCNGYLVSQDQTSNEIKPIIINAYHNIDGLNKMGSNLKKRVLEKFSANCENLKLYLELS